MWCPRYQMRDIDGTSRENAHYNGRAIKELVVCYVLSMGWTSARCVGLVPCCGKDGYQAQVLQHPQRFMQILTYIIP